MNSASGPSMSMVTCKSGGSRGHVLIEPAGFGYAVQTSLSDEKAPVSPKIMTGGRSSGSGSTEGVARGGGAHDPEGQPGGVRPCQPGCVIPVPGSVRTDLPSAATVAVPS